jgi:hypothetical protein
VGEFFSSEYFPSSKDGWRKILVTIMKSHDKSHDSSVSIAMGYRLDDRASRVRFLAGAGSFSLHHHVQKGSGAHPASYSMSTRGSFPGGKVAGV